MRLTSRNARTEATDQANVLIMSGVRVSRSGWPSAQASVHSAVPRLATAHTDAAQPARTTSRRPTGDSTPLRPCGPSTLA